MKQIKNDYQKAAYKMIPLICFIIVLLIMGFVGDIFNFLTLLPIAWITLSMGFSIRSPLNVEYLKEEDGSINFKYAILQIFLKVIISLVIYFIILVFYTSQLQIPEWWKHWHYIWIAINYVLFMINVSCRENSEVRIFSGQDVVMLIFAGYCFYSINVFSYMDDMIWAIIAVIQITIFISCLKQIFAEN